tara:strand:- start:2571 stop:2924 length:354 start_codon:yes stop_codon:yes gene_type:complete
MFQINVLFRVMKINDLLGSKQRKQLRKIAHHLRPVVTIADLKITDGVSNEVARALTDHELIKIKIDIAEKEKRQDVAVRISDSVEASLIQTIGKCVVLYKPNPTPNPKLSNLLRYSF